MTHRRIYLLLGLFTLIALSISFYSEYILNLQPCKLCRAMRYLFILLSLKTLLGLLFSSSRIIRRGMQLCLLFGFGISAYHSLIIYEFISDPCQVPQATTNINDYFSSLKNHVPCSKSALSLFKIPVPILSSVVFALSFAFLNKSKSKN